jgi:hypothetical protein
MTAMLIQPYPRQLAPILVDALAVRTVPRLAAPTLAETIVMTTSHLRLESIYHGKVEKVFFRIVLTPKNAIIGEDYRKGRSHDIRSLTWQGKNSANTNSANLLKYVV